MTDTVPSILRIYNNQLELKYEISSLSNVDFVSPNDNDLKILTDDKLSLLSTKLNVKKAEIFDLLGRKIDEYKNILRCAFNYL